MAKLTKEARNALPDSDFAIGRDLPIHDERHVVWAWDMVGNTKGLSSTQRAEARRRIVRRAKELSIDTSNWEKTEIGAVVIHARSLDIANDNHPNKMPFSGVLTRIGEPSDEAPEGAGGKRVMITMECARRALDSLLGMAVDYRPDFAGHEPTSKLGVITSARIEGNAILIGGFLYAADFPKEAAEIKENKDQLGFSFEARDLLTTDPEADPLPIVDCVFTGAAILLKSKAAYRSTSIAASAAESLTMDKDVEAKFDALGKSIGEITTGFTAALAQVTEKVTSMQASMTELKDAPSKLMAANHMSKVEPHAAALEKVADGMDRDGIGGHPVRGHAVHLRNMAGSMRADGAQGKLPHIYDSTGIYYASGDAKAAAEAAEANKKSMTDAVSALLKPIQDKIDATATQMADIKAAAVKNSAAPARKSLPPEITQMLGKMGVKAPEDGSKIEISVLDSVFAQANIPSDKRMELKTALAHAGVIE